MLRRKENTMGLRTIQEVCRFLGESTQRVTYVILKYGIPHCRLAGKVRLFNDEQTAQIKKGCCGLRIYVKA